MNRARRRREELVLLVEERIVLLQPLLRPRKEPALVFQEGTSWGGGSAKIWGSATYLPA